MDDATQDESGTGQGGEDVNTEGKEDLPKLIVCQMLPRRRGRPKHLLLKGCAKKVRIPKVTTERWLRVRGGWLPRNTSLAGKE